MAYDGEGTAYIPLAEWLDFVRKYAPVLKGMQSIIGVPQLLEEQGELMVDFAFSDTEYAPEDWSQEPKAKKQLKLNRKMPALEAQQALAAIAEMVSMNPQDPKKIVGAVRERLDLACESDVNVEAVTRIKGAIDGIQALFSLADLPEDELREQVDSLLMQARHGVEHVDIGADDGAKKLAANSERAKFYVREAAMIMDEVDHDPEPELQPEDVLEKIQPLLAKALEHL